VVNVVSLVKRIFECIRVGIFGPDRRKRRIRRLLKFADKYVVG
jgi:hypothetical protein